MTAKELMAELVSRAKAAREARAQKALTKPTLEFVDGLVGLYGIGQRSGDGHGLSGRKLLVDGPDRVAFCCSEFVRTAPPQPWGAIGPSDGPLFIGTDKRLFPDVWGNVWEPFDPDEPVCVGRWKGPGAPIFPDFWAPSAPVGDIRTFEQLRPRLVKEADDEYDMFCASGFYLDNDRIYDTAEDSDNFVFCVEHAEDGDDDSGDKYLYPDKDGNVWREIENNDEQLKCVGHWKDADGTATTPEPPAESRLDSRVETGVYARRDSLPELVNFGSRFSERLEASRFYRERHHTEHCLHGNDEGLAVFEDVETGFALYSDVYGNVWRPTEPGVYVCVGHWLPEDGEQETATAPEPPAVPRFDSRVQDGTFARGDRLPELVNFGTPLSEAVKASEFYSSHADPGSRLCETAQGHVMFADAATGSVCLPDVHGNVWRLVDPPIYVCNGHWR